MNLNDLHTFIRVAEGGSLTQAAKGLGVPKSTVSRRISRLEEELGLELVRRSARSFSLTDHGRLLWERAAPALREIDDVQRALFDSGDSPSGTLRITVPTDLGSSTFFAELMAGFRQRWPEVIVDVEMSTRMVDLVEEGYDVAVRVHAGSLPDSASLMTRTLGAVGAGVYGSPAYLEGRGEAPKEPDDLLEHVGVRARGGTRKPEWRLHHEDGKQRATVDIPAAMIANDYALILGTVVAGVGLGILPTFLADEHLAAGSLVRVLPNWRTQEGSVSLVWPATRHLAPRVRAFIDFMGEHMKKRSLIPN